MYTEIISLIGIIAGVTLFIVMSFKGFQIVISACMASLVVIITSGQSFLEVMTGTWANSFAGLLKAYFLIMVLSAMLGKLMNDAGAAKRIAQSVYGLFRQNKRNPKLFAALFAPVMYTLLTYMGISGLVVIFTVLGIGRQICKEFDIPWRLYCYSGPISIITQWLPGSLNLTNIIAAQVAGVSLLGNVGIGIVAGVVYFIVGVIFISCDLKDAEKKGEGFMETGAAFDAASKAPVDSDDVKLPNLLISWLPLLTALVLAAGFGIDIMLSMLVGVVLCIILYWKYIPAMKKTLGEGAVSAFTPVIGIAAASAVANVMLATPGFNIIVSALGALPSEWEGIGYIVLLTFIMASPMGSLNSMGQKSLECLTVAGFSPVTSARLMGISSFYSCPPHSSAIANVTAVTKLEYKRVIGIYTKVPLVGGFCALVVSLLLLKLGIFA